MTTTTRRQLQGSAALHRSQGVSRAEDSTVVVHGDDDANEATSETDRAESLILRARSTSSSSLLLHYSIAGGSLSRKRQHERPPASSRSKVKELNSVMRVKGPVAERPPPSSAGSPFLWQ